MSTALLDLAGILLIGIVTAMSVSILSSVPNPEVLTTVLDSLGLSSRDPSEIAITLAVIAGGLLIAKSVINLLLTRRILQFLANRQAMISGRLAAGLLSKPLLQVQRRSSQQTAYALTSGVGYATLNVLGQGVVAVTEFTLLAVLALGLLVVSPIVTVFTVAYFLLVALILQRVLSSWARRLGIDASHAEVSSYESVQEALRTYREAVVSSRRGLYVEQLQALRWQMAKVQSDLQFLGLVPKYVFEVALVVGAALLAASQLMTKDLDAAVAIIAVFLAAGSRIVPSMLRLQGAAILVRNASGQAAPTFELARELALTESGSIGELHLGETNPQTVKKLLEAGYTDFQASIAVRGVTLAYPDAGFPALAAVSIELTPGASLALVGPTGAGKSTLADVILGVLHPDSGEVLIGGLSPAQAVERWPGAIAYVPQDVAMVNGNVRDNVALGLPQECVDDDWVWAALERAHLDSFLRESRDGLNTVIGEHGIRLSGGQRQRLGVARALYTKPKLLVLDEATSALDAETERSIAETLRGLSGSVTTITIAHRLATIRHCDVVAYLEDGRLVASGSFDEVRRVAPHFDQQAELLGL
jgi:ABC-type multidrug transport system fused ATPase/permease subunit